MKWHGREIQLMRHRYNCQVNDPVYPPPGGWLGRCLLNLVHWLHGVPTGQMRSSERVIEIPLALDFLAHEVGDEPILELGCVLPYYILKTSQHQVLDLQDTHPDNIRRDIRSLTDEELTTNVVCISTLEHIGLAEYGIEEQDLERGENDVVRLLKRILRQARRCFITFPLGHNRELDDFVLTSDNLGACYVARTDASKERWHIVEKCSLTGDLLRENTYCRANTICVIEKTVPVSVR